MFLIAKAASEGILGLFLIIFKDFSFIESIIALNSSFSFAGLASGTSLMVAVIYGVEVITSLTSKRF